MKLQIFEEFFEKAKSIDQKIGYPDYLSGTNITELEKMYQDVSNNFSIMYPYVFFNLFLLVCF